MTSTCLVLNVRKLVKKFAREQLQRELMSDSIDHCCLSEALAIGIGIGLILTAHLLRQTDI